MIAGCSSVQISKESLQSINTINIDTHVTIPDEPFVQGNIDPISGVLFGAIGAGISSAVSNSSTSQQFQKFMKINNIDIGEIVVNEFNNELLKAGRFKITNQGDATLKIIVNTYGFGISDKTYRRPLLNVTASLIRNNEVIWSKKEYITNLSDLTTAQDINELAKKPLLLKESFGQAARIVASLTLSELHAK